ncbi:MAG: DUF4157 domain-containing protein [Dehalococcoidia bacterium]
MPDHAAKILHKEPRAVSNRLSHKKMASKATLALVDNRPEAVQLRKLQEMADRSPQAREAARLQAMVNHSPRQAAQRQPGEPLLGEADQRQAKVQKEGLPSKAHSAAENRTGMPDQLKSGLEQLSGLDLSGIRVHFNSTKPAQLNALAYTESRDINVGPGQEEHLAHEGWHAVQQLQGRVKPTRPAQGRTINDDSALEHEADVMGAKALQTLRTGKNTADFSNYPQNRAIEPAPLQRKVIQRLVDPGLPPGTAVIIIKTGAPGSIISESRDRGSYDVNTLFAGQMRSVEYKYDELRLAGGGGGYEKGEKEEKEESSESDYGGLFGQPTGLSATDMAKLLGTAEGDTLEADLAKQKALESESFNTAPAQSGGYTFVFGGHGSAKRHVESYVDKLGLPKGQSMAEIKDDLLNAAACAVKAGTLGHKGFGAKVKVQGVCGAWHLIIEHLEGKKYSIEHADLEDIY